ncbi:hypothetical protein NQZ68_019911 [Dissostichus eleginoides]|nr:hypothetical protein NQZ68_019911 [Dissostichus eleginoides]
MNLLNTFPLVPSDAPLARPAQPEPSSLDLVLACTHTGRSDGRPAGPRAPGLRAPGLQEDRPQQEGPVPLHALQPMCLGLQLGSDDRSRRWRRDRQSALCDPDEQCPTGGYERDVGGRTSVRVVSHTSVPLLVKNDRQYFQQSADTTYVFWGPERNMRQDGKGRVFNSLLKMAEKYPKVKLYAVTREKIQYCDSVFQNETGKNRMKTGAFLSTGFFTMILALDMCDSIRVYGMIDNNYCSRANHSTVPYHYYERNRVDECRMYKVHENTQRGGHRFITEKAIYAKWAARHKMEFKHPSWSL